MDAGVAHLLSAALGLVTMLFGSCRSCQATVGACAECLQSLLPPDLSDVGTSGPFAKRAVAATASGHMSLDGDVLPCAGETERQREEQAGPCRRRLAMQKVNY